MSTTFVLHLHKILGFSLGQIYDFPSPLWFLLCILLKKQNVLDNLLTYLFWIHDRGLVFCFIQFYSTKYMCNKLVWLPCFEINDNTKDQKKIFPLYSSLVPN